ncbi:MAG: helix-turn-helix domain-containing protein [Pseudomonadota bacterium]
MTVSRKRFPECPIERTIAVLSGRWKARIVWHLLSSPLRYSEIVSVVDGITERALTLALAELERDGVIQKQEQKWAVTNLGQALHASLKRMFVWGSTHAAALPLR